MQHDRDTLLAARIGALAMIERIDRQLAGSVPRAKKAPAPKKQHRISAEGRARIAAAQRRRWAAQKAGAKKALVKGAAG